MHGLLRWLQELTERLSSKGKGKSLPALNKAFEETLAFLSTTQSTDQDIPLEDRKRLSKLWDAAADEVKEIDDEAYNACFDKKTYWLDPSRWTNESITQAGISLEQMKERVKALELGPHLKEPNLAKYCDVGILTVIPAELRAVKEILGKQNLSRVKDEDGTIYLEGKVFSTLKQHSYQIAVSCIGSAGNPSAATAASSLIHRYNPSVLVLCGIAAGIRGKVKIGTVVIVDRVVAYEGAALVQKDGVSLVEPRPDMTRLTHSMNQDLAHYDPEEIDLTDKFKTSGGEFPVAKPGKEKEYADCVADEVEVRSSTAASGEKLLKDPTKLQYLRTNMQGKIEIGEMEAAGVVEACRPKKLDWLMFRGVSDFGDDFKDDEFHEFASRTAATTMIDFIERALDIEANKQASPGVMTSPCLALSVRLEARSSERFDVILTNNGDFAIDSYQVEITVPSGMGLGAANSYYQSGSRKGREVYRYRPDNHPDVLPGGNDFTRRGSRKIIIGQGDEEKVGSVCFKKANYSQDDFVEIAIDVPGHARSTQKLRVTGLFQ